MTIIEYIKKYQDKTFEEMPMTEVDNVIFSSISYIDLDSEVSPHSNNKITLEDAAIKYFATTTLPKKKKMTAYKHALEIFKKISYTKRYGSLLLYNYSYIGDDSQQFSAITIEINPKLVYVSFEGTDHLVSGWEEDFKMSYMFPVKSQHHAIRYLDRFTMSSKSIIVGGHSKGGNLALVAGMYANFLVKRKIVNIYSNDGPGLRRMQFNSKKFKDISKRLISIIPNYSLVGLLLRHNHNYKVILSSKKGVLAHDLLSWQVEDTSFITTELSTFSKILERSMLEWLNKYDDYQRKLFVDSLFSIFNRANVNSLEEVMNSKKVILKLIVETRGLDKITKKMMRDFVWLIFEYAKDSKEL